MSGEANALWSQLAMEECARCGVTSFFAAPGLRCSSLTFAAANNEAVTLRMHCDERAAAFAALGSAKALGAPVGLICTSGTAAAEFMPAVVEAAQDNVPLLLLTADRPPELLDCGANQAIDQVKLFGGFVRWHGVIPCPTFDTDAKLVLTTVDRAIAAAQVPRPGPVHLNWMFREPVVPVARQVALPDSLVAWQDAGTPYAEHLNSGLHCSYSQLDVEALEAALAQRVHGKQLRRCMVVLGHMWRPDVVNDVQKALRNVSQSEGVVVLADIASQAYFGTTSIVRHGRLALQKDAGREVLKPDVIIHAGGNVLSNRLRETLAAWDDVPLVRLVEQGRRDNPTHRPQIETTLPLSLVCGRVCETWAPTDGAWRKRWFACDGAIANAFRANLLRLSEPLHAQAQIARVVSEALPAASNLFLGNSMPIRDMSKFGALRNTPLGVIANRGASGIDGTLATAIGHALASGAPTTALLGDLAVLHDLNALGLGRYLSVPFALIVVNNDGGAIFGRLPVGDHGSLCEDYWITPHGRTFDGVAAMFGWEYRRPETCTALTQALSEALSEDGHPTLLEITIQRQRNDAICADLEQAADSACDVLLAH